MRILVPVEDPLDVACVVHFLKQHHWSDGTQFLVLHVVELQEHNKESGVGSSRLLSFSDNELIAQSKLFLSEVCLAIRNAVPNAVVRMQVVEGDIENEILRLACQWGNLTVMTSRARQGMSRFVFGSVSLDLAAHAQTSIVLLKPETSQLTHWQNLGLPTLTHQSVDTVMERSEMCRPLTRILLALDESNLCRELIQFVSMHEWNSDVEFKLVNVIEHCEYKSTSSQKRILAKSELFVQRRTHVEYLADLLHKRLPCATVTIDVVTGDPLHEIMRLTREWPADLLVVGCHFRTALERLFPTGVSLSTLCQADCAVWLLKTRSAPQDETLEAPAGYLAETKSVPAETNSKSAASSCSDENRLKRGSV
jgi:nucleotide-binding universal stress UspA family protein